MSMYMKRKTNQQSGKKNKIKGQDGEAETNSPGFTKLSHLSHLGISSEKIFSREAEGGD